MASSLIGKVEKANRYAQEKNRVAFSSFKATFQGEHNLYTLEYNEGRWHCTCRFFGLNGLCSHTMALQKMLDGMLPEQIPAEVA
ncbi:MAG: hypothetical protein HYX87_09580 [Chloroflexi bacterium]|nr:hypothetical protein [Chloroflexota bacterium]